MSKKLVLDRDSFDTVKEMLKSPDKENAVVAFTCIEQSDFKQNIVFLLLMFKEADITIQDWITHAPQTFKKIKAVDNLHTNLTYRRILDISLNYEVSSEDIQFFMNCFATHMTRLINKSSNRKEVLDLKITVTQSIPTIYESGAISTDF